MKLGLATSFVSAYNFAVQGGCRFYRHPLFFSAHFAFKRIDDDNQQVLCLVPQALEQSTHQDSDVASDMEAQRQQMVKEAQNQGGL